MQTADLIDRLAGNLRPTRQRAAWKSLIVALSAGQALRLQRNPFRQEYPIERFPQKTVYALAELLPKR
jgi:hypothetical protein